MASSNSTANLNEFFEYNELVWGDLIYGTKHLLQKIGIGVGMAFPGEEGGPKRKFKVTDPRGFPCDVSEASYMGAGIFSASIGFPGRERAYESIEWQYFAPGVQRRATCWADDFRGTADALVAAGLVPDGHFPGLPGMRKTAVIILPDGSLPQGAVTANFRRAERGAGTKRIERCSGKKYRLEITVSDELGEQRLEAARRADAAWVAKMNLLPRPPRIDWPLRLARTQEADLRRSALRLVWSRPKFVPGFNAVPPGPFAR